MTESKSPFLRFRHGTPLQIAPEIQQSIKVFIGQYKNNGEAVFKTLIKDIADGSGWGIHPDSTWHRAIYELFRIYREWDEVDRQKALKKVVEIIETLAPDTNLETIWKKVSSLISGNIEIISGWEYSHIKRFSEEEHLIRDTDGSYYKEENGRKIQVIGTKTLEENKFGYIEDNITRDHGNIGMLLKFIEEVFISLDFEQNPQHYHKQVKFLLSEGDNDTWFLHGKWRVNSAYELIPIAWHPRSCFTDIEWLKAETIALLADKCQVSKDAIPEVPMDEDSLLQFQKAFKDYPIQYEVSLDTNVLLGSNPFGKTPFEVYIDFGGRTIRWINGTKYVFPSLIIPSKDSNYEDARQIAQNFVNALVFSEKIPIRIVWSAGCPTKYPPLIRQPRFSIFMGVSQDILGLISQPRKDKEWEALSYYKEAVNSQSPYYKYVCFYNVIKLAFLNPGTNDEDNTKTDAWINKQSLRISITSLQTKLTSEKRTLGEYLRHEGGRDAVLHVGTLTRGGTHSTLKPDNQADRKKIEEIIPIVEELATKVIETGLLK